MIGSRNGTAIKTFFFKWHNIVISTHPVTWNARAKKWLIFERHVMKCNFDFTINIKKAHDAIVYMINRAQVTEWAKHSVKRQGTEG